MKKIIIIICTIFLISILILTYFYFKNSPYITSDEAKKIAMKDVSNKDNKYTFISVEYKETNKTYIYTLIFNDKNNLYTYKINAKSKKIISSKRESLKNNSKYIDDEIVLEKVLEHANFRKSNCNIISNSLVVEKGSPFYITVFYNQNVRYEYKTNAYTGSIVSITKMNENAG